MASEVQKTSNELSAERTHLSTERTDLSIERTAMAAGRTLMSWIRTALSMISFGFTIYKFLEAATHGNPVGAIGAQGPRRLGLFLIALGVVSVVLGAADYSHTLMRLNQLSTTHHRIINVTFSVAVVIGLLGFFLFITILTHTEVF